MPTKSPRTPFEAEENQGLLASGAASYAVNVDGADTGVAEPIDAADGRLSPPTYGAAEAAGAHTDGEPTTLWDNTLALGFAFLVWLGLANPPESSRDKLDTEVGPAPEAAPLSHKPTLYRMLALLSTCLLSVGSHYASHMLSGLQNTLVEELGITYTQYSLLQAAVSLVNTIVPLFGGQFVDVFGTGWGSIVSSTFIMIGDMIVAFSTGIASYPVMVVGRLIYGIGAGCIVTVQEAILAHWFHGRGLAIAVGLQISMSRLSSFLATGTVNEIADATGFYGNAFWVSASICAFSWLVNLVYVYLLRYVGEADTIEKIRKRLRQKNMFSPAVLMRFPLSFWIIIAQALLFGASWGPFTHITTGLVMDRFCDDATTAAWQASVALAVPVVGSPLIGLFCDKFGQRPLVAITAAVTLLMSCTLLGFSYANPTVGLSIFSVSLTIGPIALISSVPLVLPLTAVGTALGLYKCAINIGATIMDPIVGFLLDVRDSYPDVMAAFMVFASVTLLMTLAFQVLDFSSFHRILTANEKKRKEIEKARAANLQQLADEALLRPIPVSSYVAVGLSILLMLFSWGLYTALVVYSTNVDDTPAPSLYAAGAFAHAGTVAAAAIARWDGKAWGALATGVIGTVNAVAAVGGKLYAGGTFDMADGTPANLAEWNGSAWAPADVADVTTGPVYALASWGEALVVGGAFDDRLGTLYAGVWTPMANAPSESVHALLATDSLLYVGGAFAGPLAWNGSAWAPLGNGVDGTVLALAIHDDGALYAGGNVSAGVANPSRWTGSAWEHVGGSVDGVVRALASADGRLCVGGSFSSVAGVAARNVACWDGAAWAARGDGRDAAVRALLYFDKALVVGGDFAGGVAGVRQCGADPNTWLPYGDGPDGPVHALMSSSSSWA